MDLTKFKKESDELRANLENIAKYLNTISATIPEINEEVKKVKSAYSTEYLTKASNLKNEISALKGIDKNAKNIMKQAAEASLKDLESRMTAIEAGIDSNNERLEKVENIVVSNSEAIAGLGELIKKLSDKLNTISITRAKPVTRIKKNEVTLSPVAEDKELSAYFKSGQQYEKEKLFGNAWFEYIRGAKQDDPDCILAIADMYRHGRGTKKDLNKALECYNRYVALRPEDNTVDAKIIELKKSVT